MSSFDWVELIAGGGDVEAFELSGLESRLSRTVQTWSGSRCR